MDLLKAAAPTLRQKLEVRLHCAQHRSELGGAGCTGSDLLSRFHLEADKCLGHVLCMTVAV